MINVEATKTEDNRHVLKPTENLGTDFRNEVELEVNEIKGTGDIVNPNHTDQLVQNHVTGLAISFFVIIAVILLATIGAIYWYSHTNH